MWKSNFVEDEMQKFRNACTEKPVGHVLHPIRRTGQPQSRQRHPCEPHLLRLHPLKVERLHSVEKMFACSASGGPGATEDRHHSVPALFLRHHRRHQELEGVCGQVVGRFA